MTTITVYIESENNKIKGFWNGKVYSGMIYINLLNSETMTIDFKHSVKLPYDASKIFVAAKSTREYNAARQNKVNTLPTNVTDWMRLMEKSER